MDEQELQQLETAQEIPAADNSPTGIYTPVAMSEPEPESDTPQAEEKPKRDLRTLWRVLKIVKWVVFVLLTIALLIGGVLGLIFSFLISIGINLFSFGAFGGGGITWDLVKQALVGGEGVVRTSVIKPELIIFALVFSVLVGLVSGYQPANKAVKVSALEAIRNE